MGMKILSNTQQVISFLANFTLQTSLSRDYFTISDDITLENNAEEINLSGKSLYSPGYRYVGSAQRKNDEQLLMREIDRRNWLKNDEQSLVREMGGMIWLKNDEQLLMREIDRKIWLKNEKNEQLITKRKNNELKKINQELREAKKENNREKFGLIWYYQMYKLEKEIE